MEQVISFGGFFVSIIVCFTCYELLVRREYIVARDCWEADGRPPGVVWAGEGSSTMRSWTRNAQILRLMFSTPTWVLGDTRARTAQVGMRVSWLVAFGFWLWLMLIITSGRGGALGS